ncbi:TonB-dependent receptor [Hymenobacter elongatus]|uniref:SusC/RagA family TonB-linked outer membrane protein n=1 Tax=Hymenobacter elongatus TaxID=877208 RepID=A0A4Z0PHE5_9BACT|nr:TonB-dependent receptor [Hymenobacter elongatus]TGE14233.1 SusC/RagA family TonB-linked outer membrane protein [Hymenobacter elongatus]
MIFPLLPRLAGHLKRIVLLQVLSMCFCTGLALAGPADAQPLLAQPVTIQATAETVKSVLSRIETQTTARFQYSSKLIGASRRVSVDIVEQPLAQALHAVLDPLRISYELIPSGIILSPAVVDATVTGRVIDEKGAALPGVNVTVKGGSTGTQTDADGRYSLSVPDNATLVFSFIGYAAQEVAVVGRTTVDVALAPDTETLSEVVVVGYGTQQKRDVTGAVARVEAEEIVNQPVQTPTQALQGKTAGVQIISDGTPNAQPKVRIRGTGTLLAGAEPLYVVDGVQTTDIRNLSNSDIETIDVLKDASAAAIYGVRGANGVIIVTTKKGKQGKPVLSYNSTVGFKQAANLVQMADAEQYTKYLRETAPTLTIPDYSGSTNWYDQILRRSTYQNHNLAVSGANENVRYYFSGNLLEDNGIAIGNRFSRLTVRSNTDFTISPKLSLNSQASFSRANTKDVNFATAFQNAYRAAPIITAKEGGRYGNTSAYGNVGNPVLDIEKNDNRSLENRLQGNVGLDFRPIEGLTLRSAINLDLNFNNRRVYDYQYLNNETTFLKAGGGQQRPFSELNVTQVNSNRYLWENTATYQRVFAEKHNLTLLAGTVVEEGTSNSLSGSRRNVPEDPNQWYLSTGDPTTSVNGAPTIGKDRRLSYLGRLNYAFADKYLLTTNVRYDGTSKFGANQRWGLFPSLGLGWILTEEGFLKDQSIVDFLKLRASYGQLGNDQIDPTAYIVTAEINTPYVFGDRPTLGAIINQIKNPDVRWEVTTEYDLALEFATLDNHLSGEVTYYQKKTADALIPVNIPGQFGDPDNQYITNAADISNQGLEAALNWRATVGDKFSYNFGVNATFNKNRIENLNGGQALFGGANNVTRSDNGVAAGSFYVLQTVGVFQNQGEIDAYPKYTFFAPKPGDLKYADTDGNGTIDLRDRVYAGSYQPPMYFGINGGLNFRGLDFSFVFSGNVNNKVYNRKKQATQSDTDNVEADFANSRWSATNPSQTDPFAIRNNTPNSTYFIESGSYLRLNNLVLGYTIPGELTKKAYISSLRVFASGQNLFTVTNYSGFTPELPGGPLDSGIEATTYPTSRTLALGLNVNF